MVKLAPTSWACGYGCWSRWAWSGQLDTGVQGRLARAGDPVLVHSGEHMGRPLDLLGCEAPRVLEPRHDGPRQLLRARVDDGQGLAGSYAGAHRRLDHDAGGVVDGVFLLLPADAQLEPRQPHLEGVDRRHVAITHSKNRQLDRRHGQALFDVAALRGKHLEKLGAAGARSEGITRIRVDLGQPAHLPRDHERDLHQLLVALAGKRIERLLHLQRVADRAAERVVHGGDQRHRAPARPLTQQHHLGRQLLGRSHVRHKGAAPELDVEHDGVGARGDLLGHHARGDQRHRRHGACNVAQGVKRLIRRHHVGRLRGDRDPDLAHLADEAVGVEIDGEPGHRLQLVQRPPGVRQRTAAELGHLDAARGRQRRADEGDFVADAAGRMLVHLRAWNPAQVEDLPTPHHRLRERESLGAGHSADADGHEPGRHLVVRDIALEVAGQQEFDLLRGVLAAVPLAANDLERVHGRMGSRGRARPRLSAAAVAAESTFTKRQACPHLAGQVLTEPSFIPLSAAASFACRAALMRLSLPWNGEMPIPLLAALNRLSPGFWLPAFTALMAASTALLRCFSAEVTMQGSAFGYDRNWSTSTPIAKTLAAQAASSTPLPVLPATWKRTSACVWLMSCAPSTLPATGSLNAFVKSLVVTYAVSTLIFGLIDLAPSSKP